MIALNAPNLITLSRVLMVPLFVGLFYVPDAWLGLEQKNLWATVIFVLAAITDWLDGWLARKLDQMSAFGAFFDPVADKLMVAGALILLLQLGRVESVVTLIIIGREIAVSALREWMATIGRRTSVAVAFIGKLKTVAQMVAVPMLLFYDPIFGLVDCQWIGTILINIAAVLTVVSMLYYLRKALPHLGG